MDNSGNSDAAPIIQNPRALDEQQSSSINNQAESKTPTTPFLGPKKPAGTPLDSKRDKAKTLKILAGVFGVLIIGFLVVGVSVIASRQDRSKNNQVSGQAPTLEGWSSYSNPEGFSFRYPQGVVVSEESDFEIKLAEQASVSFLVADLQNSSLREVVELAAGNLSARFEDDDSHLFIVNARAGYMFETEEARHYYFPLSDNKYLRVVAQLDDHRSTSMQIVSSLSFSAPETQATGQI